MKSRAYWTAVFYMYNRPREEMGGVSYIPGMTSFMKIGTLNGSYKEASWGNRLSGNSDHRMQDDCLQDEQCWLSKSSLWKWVWVGFSQRKVRKTRELARTDICGAWLTADWKFSGDGSCKECAVPPAYAEGCPAVIWGVCTPAVEEKDYDVMYSIDGVHWTFNICTTSNLLRSLLLSGFSIEVLNLTLHFALKAHLLSR